MSNSLQPHGLQPTRLLCPWDSPGKSAGVGCHSLPQRAFPTQGLNPGLPQSGRTLLSEPPGSPPQSCSPKEAGSADHLSELGIMSPPLTSVGASSWKQPNCHLDHALLRLSRGPRSATPAFLTHRNGHFSATKLVVVATQQLKTNALTTTQKEN